MEKFSVKKPFTVLVAVIMVIMLGLVSVQNMQTNLLPNVNTPYLMVVTVYPGASPERVENEVSDVMESALGTISGVKNVTATSAENYSLLLMEFEDDTDMNSAVVKVSNKVDQTTSSLPSTCMTPSIIEYTLNMNAFMTVAVSREGSDSYELADFVNDTMVPYIERQGGVSNISANGLVTRMVQVQLDQEKIDAINEKLLEVIDVQLADAKAQLDSAEAQIEDGRKQYETQLANYDKLVSDTINSQYSGELQDSFMLVKKQAQALLDSVNQLIAVVNEPEIQQALIDVRDGLQRVVDKFNETGMQDIDSLIEIVAELRDITDKLTTALQELQQRLNAQGDTAGTTAGELADDLQVQQSLNNIYNTLESTIKAMDDVPGLMDQFTQIVGSYSQQQLQAYIKFTEAREMLNNYEQQLADAKQQYEDAKQKAMENSDVAKMLDINTLAQLIYAQNFSMPAGYVKDSSNKSWLLKVGEEYDSIEDISGALLLHVDGFGDVRLSDVADVQIIDNAEDSFTRLNGERSVVLKIFKSNSSSAGEVSGNCKAAFKELEQKYDGLHVVVLSNQGNYISIIVSSILSSMLIGAALAIIVLAIFLKDIKPTLVVGISIPLSVLFAVVLMYFTGLDMNIMTLAGLSLGIGMLVDNSVVVIENIYRLRAKGANVRQAAVAGAGQVLGAITSSTLTTVCVFLPIVFVEGITKQLFTDLALTMTFSLLASLIIALTLVPAMAAGMLKKNKPIKPGLLDKIYPGYRRAVSWSLGHKAVVLGVAVVLLVGSALLTLQRGFVFMPKVDLNTVSVTITMPDGCSYEKAAELADEVARRAMTVENVQTVGAAMSADSSMPVTSMDGSSGAYDVTAYIIVPEGESGDAAGRRIMELCQDMECKVTYAGAADSMTQMMTGSGISLRVYGEKMEDLQAAAKTVGEAIGSVEGVQAVSDGLTDAVPAVHLTVDRAKAMKHGMTVAQVYMQVASALSTATSGSDMTLDSQDMGVTIALPEERTVDLEHLLDLEITPGSSVSGIMGGSMDSSMTGGAMGSSASTLGSVSSGSSGESFRLGEVATMERTVSLSTINRQEQRRCINVTAQVDEDHNVTKVSAEAIRAVERLTLPEGVTTEFSGENETIMDAMQQLLLMLVLGILLVYLVMVAQFQSLKSPFIVMFTIPLAFTGGFIILLVSGVELSVVSLIGFVMLVGVIVNNGIVLVDYINQQRQDGMARREAIIDAGVTRLRPILMTSLTTILGLVVTALAKNAGTALIQPIALVCIGGLLYATLMTLFVVPCMYDMMNKKELRKVDDSELELLDI